MAVQSVHIHTYRVVLVQVRGVRGRMHTISSPNGEITRGWGVLYIYIYIYIDAFLCVRVRVFVSMWY